MDIKKQYEFQWNRKSLGITLMSADCLRKTECTPSERHRKLAQLGIPVALLPPAEDVSVL